MIVFWSVERNKGSFGPVEPCLAPADSCAHGLGLAWAGSTSVDDAGDICVSPAARKFFCPTSAPPPILYPMTDSGRHIRERSPSGDFDVTLFRCSVPQTATLIRHLCSPISIRRRSSITMTLLVSPGGRKTPSEGYRCQYAYVPRLTSPSQVRRPHVVTRTESRSVNSACASNNA
jgi:hypothetical protein